MRIRLTKISDDRHALELLRADGSRERIELVTRETLFHDFLHYAVESSLPTDGGFWGALASGKTMAEMNDRSGESVKEFAATLYEVEAAVGMMTGVSRMPAEEGMAAMRRYFESQDQELPSWCTKRFLVDVHERMRRLLGQWKATPYGESMEMLWPADALSTASRPCA